MSRPSASTRRAATRSSRTSSSKSRGKALLYTTHYMEEVERLADRIVVIDHGRVIADDTLAGLQSRVAVAGGGRATLETVFLTLTGRSLRD